MIFPMWRLSEGGDDNLGLACTADGLILGRTPLIERRDRHFAVRERNEIERLLRRAYQTDPPIERIMSGLATVARGLNEDDQCLARIAAVHLRIPDLPSPLARSAVEAEDRLIKYARDEGGDTDWDPAKHPRTGAPPNPGWFAPTDGGADESSQVAGESSEARSESSPAGSKPFETSSEPSPVQIAANDDPTRRSDTSLVTGDDWVRLPPGPKRIDELADFVEWMANAKPQDEQTIRAEIKRYFYDAGDQGSAAALNSALTVLLKPGLTRQDRQRILDRLDVFTRADPAEYARNRDWATGAAIAAAGGAPPANVNEAAAAEGAMTAAGQAETASRVWQLGWAARGKYFNEQLGANLSATFPVIDRFADGTATSIKSINLNAATYKNPRSLINRLGNYINDLEEFEGITRSDDEVAKSDIKSRVLSLAIPKGGMTEQQKIVIESVRDWARTLRFPIEIIITEF